MKPDSATATREEMSEYLHQFRDYRPLRHRYDDRAEPETPPIRIELQWPDTQERAAHWREVNLLSEQVRELRVQMRKLHDQVEGLTQVVTRISIARQQNRATHRGDSDKGAIY